MSLTSKTPAGGHLQQTETELGINIPKVMAATAHTPSSARPQGARCFARVCPKLSAPRCTRARDAHCVRAWDELEKKAVVVSRDSRAARYPVAAALACVPRSTACSVLSPVTALLLAFCTAPLQHPSDLSAPLTDSTPLCTG